LKNLLYQGPEMKERIFGVGGGNKQFNRALL